MTTFLAPEADALCKALLHSLWLGAFAAVAFWGVRRLRWLGPRRLHDLGCLLLGAVPLAVVSTFSRILSEHRALPTFAGNLGVGSLHTPLAVGAVSETTAMASGWAWPGWASTIVAAAWLACSTGLLLRSGMGLWIARRTTSRSSFPLPEELQRSVALLVQSLGLPPATKVVSCHGAVVPYTYGWLLPVVVVPMTAIAGLDATSLQMLLRHELVHVRRRDFVFNVMQSVVESLLFYHPLVWWLSAQVRQEREAACDLEVVDQGMDRVAYARALIALEELRQSGPALALGARGGSLKTRIQRIVARENSRPIAGWLLLAMAGGLVVGGILAACTVDASKASGPSSLESGMTSPSALGIAWLPPDVSRHRAALERSGVRHRVDPNLLALMVLVESGGQSSARSPMGAVGLMQLMPSTAREVARRAGLDPPTDEALFDVDQNVDLGARLVAELYSTSGNDDAASRLRHVLSAYNAGSNAVRAHMLTGAPLPEETVRYVALIEALYGDRSMPNSPTYQAWRQRAVDGTMTGAIPPVEGGRVTSAYGSRVHPIDMGPSFHDGVDIAHKPGTAVRAVVAGVVSEVGQGIDDRGLFVVVRHPRGVETRYHHLGSVVVKQGQWVSQGEALGSVGNTGKSTGPHVHFELRDQGRSIDPADVVARH